MKKLIIVMSLMTFSVVSKAQPEGISRRAVDESLISGFLELLRHGRSYRAPDEDLRRSLNELGYSHLREVREVDPGLFKQELYETEKHGGPQNTFSPDLPFTKIRVIMISRDFAGKNRLKQGDRDFDVLSAIELQFKTIDALLAYLQRISEMTKEESLRFHPAFRAQALDLIENEIETKLESVSPKEVRQSLTETIALRKMYGNFVASLIGSAVENTGADFSFSTLRKVVENRIYHLRALDVSRPMSLAERCGKKYKLFLANRKGLFFNEPKN